MSTSLVLGTIGAGIGSIFGMPGVGFSIGAALGSSSLHSGPSISQYGPRLDSLQVQSSRYGMPIPLHYGRNRLAGQIIWSSSIQEHSETHRLPAQSGQHHPHVTTYRYTASFAILLCKGPVSSFGRIWLDGKLYLDMRGQCFESLHTSTLRKDNITFYPGNEEQLPDPTMQAYLGADNVPAYRGYCYIVFADLVLDDYGRRIPQVTVELFTNTKFEQGKVYPPVSLPSGLENSHFTCLQGNILRLYNRTNKTVQLLNLNAEPINIINRQPSIDGDSHDQTLGCLDGKLLRFWGNALYPLQHYSGSKPVPSMRRYPVPEIIPLPESSADQTPAHIPPRTASVHYVLDAIIDKTQTLLGFAISADQQRALVLLGYGAPYYHETCNPHEWYRLILTPTGAQVEAKGKAQGFDISLSPYAGMSHRTGLPNTHPNVACCLENNGQYLWLAQNSGEKHVLCYEVKEIEMTLVYQSRCQANEQRSLSILADNGFCWVTDGNQVEKYARITITTAKDPRLSDVIISLCEQAGLSKKQVDVSAVKRVQSKPPFKLPGYTVNQSSNVRNSLQTLLTAYPLVAVESNGKLKFVLKSKKPVTVIPHHKLLVASSSSRGNQPSMGNNVSSFSLHRQSSAELPQRMSISYAECASDYQVSTQSATRTNLSSQHSQMIEIPLVLESSQAQQIAEDLLRDAWQSRETHQFALGLEYLFLEPGDVIQLQIDAALYTLAITQLEIGNGQLQVQGVRVEASNKQSFKHSAAKQINTETGSSLSQPSATYLRIIELPADLYEHNDNPAYTIAACGYTANWRGAIVYYQETPEDEWQPVLTIQQPATIGAVLSTDAESLRVKLLQGELFSITDEQFAEANSRSNLALVGNEIIQYQNAILQTDGSYQLSHIKRGLYGTSAASCSNKSGKPFLKLDNCLQRLDINPNVIGQPQRFKVITLGLPDNNTIAQTFTIQSKDVASTFNPAGLANSTAGKPSQANLSSQNSQP